MAGSRFSIEAVISMIDRVTGPMKTATGSVSMFSSHAKRQVSGFDRAVMKTGSVIKGVIGANLLQGAVVGIGQSIDRAITLASDLTEVQNVVDTTFGSSAGIINKWSQTAITQFGLSELQAKKFNGTMGAMLKSSGLPINNLANMSTKLSGLAGDFASFYNLDAQEAFDKIRSGISGETEPLKQLGINMSVANLQAFALTQGIRKNWNSMSQAEQVMLRYNYLLGVSKDAQGDFAKTLQTSYANQKRVFSTNLDQTLARIATQVLPDLTGALINLNKWLTTVDAEKIGKGIKSLVGFLWDMRYVIIAVIAAWVGYRIACKAARAATIGLFVIEKLLGIMQVFQILGFADGIKYFCIVAKDAMKATKAWTLAQSYFNVIAALNPIGLICAGILLMIALIIVAIKYWDDWGAALVIFMGPMGMILSAVMAFKTHWSNISSSFENGGILAGLKAIGMMLIDVVLYPLQKILEVIARVTPGKMGRLFAGAAGTIQEFRQGGLSIQQNQGEDRRGFAQADNYFGVSPFQPSFASPMSSPLGGGRTFGQLDINVNAPKGIATTRQSGTMPQGARINKGAQ